MALRALDSFSITHNGLPKPWDIEDATKFIQIAKSINESSDVHNLNVYNSVLIYQNKVDINEDILKMVSFTSRGSIVGLTAFLGGLAAQQVLVGVTGKFTPLNQWVHILPQIVNRISF